VHLSHWSLSEFRRFPSSHHPCLKAAFEGAFEGKSFFRTIADSFGIRL
jgi:hypothetical protein